jgi:hypothetical protein
LFVDKAIKYAVVAALLMVGFSVFYHYVIHLPSVERDKLAAEDRERAQAQSAAAAQRVKYITCKRSASESYNSDWTRACTSVAASKRQKLQSCLTDRAVMTNQYMGEHFCRESYGSIDPSPDCVLPRSRAENINATLDAAEQKCLLEARGGL